MSDALYLRQPSGRHRPRPLAWLLVSAVVVLATQPGCGAGGPSKLAGRASGEWNRSYTLTPGGELQIVGAAGSIDVRGSDTGTIEVRAERIVRAGSDAMAKPMVERVRIAEEVTPDKVILRSEGLGGIIIGVDVEVNFHVSVPASTKIRLRAAGGSITLADLAGPVVASTSNGAIDGTRLRGGVDARTVNGDVHLQMSALGQDPVDLRAVNGSIELTMPVTVDANVAANATNGAIDVAEIPLELTGEQSKRRVRGRLNNGGTPVELTTTNGNVRVRAAQ